jgi:flagellar motor switch protein FliG
VSVTTNNLTARDELSGAQKSAVLCMALGSQASAKVFQKLSETEVEQITLEIASLQKVEFEAADAVLREYREVAHAAQQLAAGGVDYARSILTDALGDDRSARILKRIQEQLVNSGLRRLRKAPPELLHSIFRGEHPQTVALILSHLDPAQAATVIASMNTELAGDVLHRVARMDKVSPEMIQIVEAALSGKADLSLTQMMQSGGPESVANVLNYSTASMERALLDAIGEHNQDLAEEIKNLMFVFEDIVNLDKKAIQRVLREVDGRDLAMALKAASDEVKNYIIKNMSERASAALLEEIEFMGAVRVKDVEEAQAKIIATIRNLEESGEIMLADRSGDDFIA